MKRLILLTLFLSSLPLTGVFASSPQYYRPQQLANNHDTNQVEFTFEESGLLNQSFVNISSGAAQFELPIMTPPGVNNLQPSLVLGYNSQMHNTEGAYGYGWSLGAGEIHRVNKHGIPQMYGDSPVFRVSLPGVSGELVLLSSTASEEVYGLKRESRFATITHNLVQNSWEVVTQQGVTYTLGSTSDARFANADESKVYAWKLEEVEELHGNTITYSYKNIEGIPYLKRVSYGGLQGASDPFVIKFLPFDTAGVPTVNKVKQRLDYRTGFAVSPSHLVEQIQVEVDAALRYTYNFTYTQDDLGARDHLSSIEMIGYDAQSSTVSQSVDFSYYTRDDGFAGELGHRTNLLREVQFSKGGKLTYDYLPTTKFLQASGEKVPHHLHYPLIAVESVKKTDPFGRNDIWAYHYSDAYFHYESVDEREMAGFGVVTETNPLGEKSVYYFHQAGGYDGAILGEYQDTHWSLIGNLYRTEKYSAQQDLMQRSIAQWVTEDLQDGRFYPQKVYEMQTIIGLNTDPDVSTATKYIYDSDTGNVLEVLEYGDVDVPNDGSFSDIGTDSRKTIFTYAEQASLGIHGFLASQEIRDHSNTLVARKEVYYDNLVLGQVSVGNQTQTKQRFLEESRDIATTQTFSSAGLLLTQQDALGNQTTYTYPSGNLYPSSVTNDLGHTTTVTYDRFFGKMITSVDANGLDTQTILDGFGRVVEEKLEDPQTSQLVTMKSYQYQETTPPHSVTQLVHISASNTLETITYTDGFGRSIQSRVESDSGQYSVVNTEYDALDREVSTSLPVFENGSAYNASQGSAKFTTTTYDALARPRTVTNSLGTTSVNYTGWEKQVTDAEGNTKRTVTDAFGRLVELQEDLGVTTLTTSYTYDALDRLVKLIDAEGNVREFEHDSLGRITKQDDLHDAADTGFGEWEYTYDDNGNVLTTTNPNGDSIVYTYDDLNRVLTEQKQGDVSTLIMYQYDTGTNQKGRLTGILQTGLNWEGVYDLRGRLVSEEQVLSGSTYTKSYSFSAYDLPEQVVYPNATALDYGYDSVGNLVTIDQGANSIIANIEYTPQAKLGELLYGNGVESVFEYDVNKEYRLVRKQSTITGGSPSALQDLFYTYDAVGNITNLVEAGGTIATRDIDYTYDDLYRLTEADNTTTSEVRTYAYDAIGNITNKSDQGDYTYAETGTTNPQAVTEIKVGSTSKKRFTYDDNGNLTRQEEDTALGTIVSEFDWDHLNRMTESRITDEALTTTTTSYTYNSAGMRLKKTVDDGTTSFTTLYPFPDYELTQANTEKISVSAGNALIAVIESDSSSSVIYYHHNDHLGGSNIITDGAGAVVQVVDYHPFGETRVNAQSASYNATQKFTGHELDDSTGLYYAKARYYDPLIGRFISQDPLQMRPGELMEKFSTQPQAFNYYAYVTNNPLVFVDPEGESPAGYAIWKSGVKVLQMTGNYLASDLLDNSISPYGINFYDEPHDKYFGYYDNASDLYVRNLVRESRSYQQELAVIELGIRNGEIEGSDSFTFTHKKDGSDLHFALGTIRYSYWAREKNGGYDLEIVISDTYDFTEVRSLDDLFTGSIPGFSDIVNDAGTMSMVLGELQDYDVNIYMRERIEK